VVRKRVAGIRQKMTACGAETVTGEAFIKDCRSGILSVECNDELYEAENLLICTGSETSIPPIEGLDSTAYWTSREALQAKERPASLIIIGGGVIGMEFASFFNSLGTEVQVVEMTDEILPGMDREMASLLRAEYAKRGVRFYLGHKVVSVSEGKVTVEKDGRQQTLEGEKLLLSAGRRPVTKGFGIESLSLQLAGRGLAVDGAMRTCRTNVFACGDVTGYSMLAHTAVSEAETAIDNILGGKRRMNYRAVPGVVYTNPELACIGATEEQLQAAGEHYLVKKLPMAFSGRFVAENELGNGLCKCLLDGEGRLLGIHLLGNPASELAITAGMAIQEAWTDKKLAAFVFPHPTVGEILKETLLA
jgi:dihydrolipoamide dehydrogenase